MKSKLEPNIPIPPQGSSKWAKLLLAMNPRDSFTVQTPYERVAVLSAAKNSGIAITTRKLDGAGYRIWRL